MLLNRSNSEDSYLKTSSNFNFNVGTSEIKKNLTINANATTIGINGATINNASDTTINNKGTTTITGNSSIILQKQDSNKNILGHIRFDVDSNNRNRVQLGIPTVTGGGQKSLITLSNNGANT